MGVSLALSNGLELQEVRAGSMGGVEGAGDIGPYAFHRVEGVEESTASSCTSLKIAR